MDVEFLRTAILRSELPARLHENTAGRTDQRADLAPENMALPAEYADHRARCRGNDRYPYSGAAA
jgi:hypothetical protein